MTSWLDTQTQAMLKKSAPEKLAPADTATFTLVLLSTDGSDRRRLVRAIMRIVGCSRFTASRVLARHIPSSVKGGLSWSDAVDGQFELISADAISVFLADQVLESASPDYLRQLYAQLLQSPEFDAVSLRIESIPATDRGEAFLDQFFVNDDSWKRRVLKVPRKKARIMEHWASEIGGQVSW